MINVMARIHFTSQLRRFIDAPEMDTAASTLRQALSDVFGAHPRLQGYVLDDQGSVRKHVTVFVNRGLGQDRQHQAQPVHDGDQVLVAQALTGG